MILYNCLLHSLLKDGAKDHTKDVREYQPLNGDS
jgi:hypothetical protein